MIYQDAHKKNYPMFLVYFLEEPQNGYNFKSFFDYNPMMMNLFGRNSLSK